jgi:glycosyltransferase involved in cell wall biosynthesis
MRVLLLPHRFPPHGRGGVETWALSLRRGLTRFGLHVGVATRDDRNDLAAVPPCSAREEVDDIGPVYWIRHRHQDARTFRDTWSDPRMEAVLLRLIRTFQPDLLHVAHPDGFGVLPFRLGSRLGLPVVATLHDPKWLCVRGQMVRPPGLRCTTIEEEACTRCVGEQLDRGPIRGTLARLAPSRVAERQQGRDAERGLDQRSEAGPVGARRWRVRQAALRSALEGADAVISPSQFLAARFSALGIQRGIHVVSNGVAPEAPRPLPAGPLRIGWFGSDVPAKGLDVLLRAVDGIANVTLELHGDVQRSSLPASVVCRGPYLPAEVGARMAGVHAVCVPSTWEENQPMVVLESRRAGRPVIASRLGGLNEMVFDGVDGWLVPPDDAAELGRLLGELADDPGRVARAAAAVNPPSTDDEMAEAHIAIYRACTGEVVPI